MVFTPLLNQPQDAWGQTAFYNLARLNCDNPFKIAILRMKMRGRMIVVVRR